jgi:hypothetical protein
MAYDARSMPPPYLSCPIAARFIVTPDDACAYYEFKFVGDHPLEIGGRRLTIRFNAEEIHIFTDTRSPCPAGHLVARIGVSGEVRCFCLDRARKLDAILPTLRAPAAALRAKIPGGTAIYGPADASAWRLAVVVAPSARENDVYFVRTMFPVSPKDFQSAIRGDRSSWPPK